MKIRTESSISFLLRTALALGSPRLRRSGGHYRCGPRSTRLRLRRTNDSLILSHFLHEHEEQIIDIGPGRAGEEKVCGGTQEGIGIVAAEVVGCGEAGTLASCYGAAVGDAAGAVGGAVGAVGCQRNDCQTRQMLQGEGGGQGEFLVAAALAGIVTQADGGFAAEDQAGGRGTGCPLACTSRPRLTSTLATSEASPSTNVESRIVL